MRATGFSNDAGYCERPNMYVQKIRDMSKNLGSTVMAHYVQRGISACRRLARWLTNSIRVSVVHIINWPVKIPFTVTIGKGVMVAVTDEGRLEVDKFVSVGALSQIRVRTGKCTIGYRTELGQGAIIACQNAVDIGKDVLIAEYVTIRDQDHNFDDGVGKSDSGFTTAPILIGDNVWLGAKVTVTKGVSIGENSVIGANSVVTRDIPANVLAVGVPARVIRSIERDNSSLHTSS